MPGSRRGRAHARPAASFRARARPGVCARRAHARVYLTLRAVSPGGFAASRHRARCRFVGRQSRWAGSGIPRRARVSGTHRAARIARLEPGNSARVLSRPFAVSRKDVAALAEEYPPSLRARRDTRPLLLYDQRSSRLSICRLRN